MQHNPLLIPSSANFWSVAARALLEHDLLRGSNNEPARDCSALRVVVPTFEHAQLLRAALAQQLGGVFIPPRITTFSVWCAQVAPGPGAAPAPAPAAEPERLMSLYAELRQHAWLKKLFTARRNTDLLPLAQMLLTLCDELTQSLLPAIQHASDAADARWQHALAQLPPSARHLLSDEAQLVWSIWKSQLDGSDATAVRFAQMMRLAAQAQDPLVWITPIAPNPFEQAFLDAYSAHQTVWPIMLDWRSAAVDATYAAAWSELLEDDEPAPTGAAIATPHGLSLCAARSLEQEAQQGAQTILNWLQAGKSTLAIVAQDRVVARRMRALLERAQVYVADETGWKLSTTRAASAIAAWFEVITARAETAALLDLLKSPFLFADIAAKSAQLMAIEIALRRANVSAGWEAASAALEALPAERAALARIAQQASLFSGRKSLAEWIATTDGALHSLGMVAALQADAAGAQVIALLESIAQSCHGLNQAFSFAEWRAFVSLQLEATAFVPPDLDRRVVMLPLNGARLRSFDAVLVVGGDADHLPSQPNETLFFANAVRRELGLATRESRQRQQLRDLVELLSSNREVVLSWQSYKDGEPNPVSTWIARLQLTLERAGAATVTDHVISIPLHTLTPLPQAMPNPAAPQLLPTKLSASGYGSLVACPYQFFATRMLGLSGLDELSDMPEKRDYGDWLHRILRVYHETVRDQAIGVAQRADLLQNVSAGIFARELDKSAAALGYYARWQKVMPAYLNWANEREAQGWHFVVGEQRFEKILPRENGAITLHGRIDRIDQHDDGERAVLDYKTQSTQVLRDKIKHREDHQLAFYGLLSDQPIAAGHYVALEATKDKTGDVAAPDYVQWQQALERQIGASMHAIGDGAALRATGIETVCQYCDVRGLCRKGAWR